MNNLKKLLAAVMSLAMVATVVPAAPVNAINDTTCGKETWTKIDGYLTEVAKLEKAFGDLEGVKVDDYIDEYTTATYTGVSGEYVGDLFTESEALKYFATIDKYTLVSCDVDKEAVEYAQTLYAVGTETEALAGRVEEITKYIDKNFNQDVVDEIIEKKLVDDAKEAITRYTWYVTELTGTDYTNKPDTVNPERGAFADYLPTADYEDLEEIVEFMEENAELLEEAFSLELTNVYAKALLDKLETEEKLVETVTSTHGAGYRAVITPANLEYVKAGRRSGSTYELTKLIEKIEADKYVKGYDKHADEDAVVEIMDALNALLETSEYLDEVVETLKDTAAAGKIGATNKDEANTLGTGTYDKNNTWSEVFADVTTDNFAKFMANVNAPEYDALVELVEVVEEFYTVYVQKTGTRYVAKTIPTELHNNMKTVFDAAGVDQILESNGLFQIYVDPTTKKKTENTNYEVLTDHMAAVAEAYETVTTGVKGVTVNNLTSKNAQKVVAAYNALKVVDKNATNLTEDEEDAVADARLNINLLWAKALLNGVVTDVVTGWVDLGDGNWDYYGEDGNVVTGWVAAGSDWYYVKNGHMLRNSWIAKDATGAVWYYVGNDGAMVSNTVVDGYTINANGEWVK